jgi:hypothetical protein
MTDVAVVDPVITKATDLARKGFTVSAIYGALKPYITRIAASEIVAFVKREAADRRDVYRSKRAREIAERFLADEALARQTRRLSGHSTLADLIYFVSTETGISRTDLLGPSRLRHIIEARQMLMYRAAVETDKSYPIIGKAISRDHSTVIYGIQAHCRRNKLPLPRGMKFSAKAKRIVLNTEASAS